MVLEIVKYGDPVLRQKGQRIGEITPEINKLVEDMIETMYAAQGVGLAAQQIGKALQIAVIDVSEAKDRPSTLIIDGKEVDPTAFMPMVMINPEIEPNGPPDEGPEGCLSFPELYADVTRPESIKLTAHDRHGQRYHWTCGGLLARAVQHEADHLNGILFIDRMSKADKEALREDLLALQEQTKAQLKSRK
jgi:peptide deformylase